jgi:hypothetical protein
MPIKYKIPIIKPFRYLGNARPKTSSYTNFMDTPATGGVKIKKKAKKVFIPDEIQLEARAEPKDTYINDSNARIKTREKITIKINGKRKKVDGFRVKVSGGERKEESMEKYKQRLNFNFVKKKHYGRFTKNPRQTGREVMPVSNELTTDAYFNEVYNNTTEVGE